MNLGFWKNKRVFLTGHTGFKGTWMSLLLAELGAKVYGYSLEPATEPSLFQATNAREVLAGHTIGDIRDQKALKAALDTAKPDVVLHFAAQPLVRESYKSPFETFEINAMGTARLLDLLRDQDHIRSALIITTDKVYLNKEWFWAYREDEPLGGYDPYSASKACTELVVNSYRQSFFPASPHKTALATARAGNVIGGGDWSRDRLIPDLMTNWKKHQPTVIRYPQAIRPWQHVLEPVTAYLHLIEDTWMDPMKFSQAWNFGPPESDCLPVGDICAAAQSAFGRDLEIHIDQGPKPHEANFLKLDCSKAKSLLDWKSVLPIRDALTMTFDWYKRFYAGENAQKLTLDQIRFYTDRVRG